MNKTLAVSLMVIGGIVLTGLVFGTGLIVGRINTGENGYGPFPMMGNGYRITGGNRVMGGYRNNDFGMMGGNGMMGGYRFSEPTNAKPLTVDQAKQAVESFLNGLNNSDLELKEIMIFDNNAYARITEKSTGIGAMELLVDPASLAVFPEHGPNMMWNLKYSHMGGAGRMMGSYNGMMGNSGANPGSDPSEMTVKAEQALVIAQQYLDQQYSGYKTAEDADLFYGYYTIDIMKDGKPTGMLSVNGFSGQVFLHSWHGTFVEMSE